MAQIKIDLGAKLVDGMDIKFKAPCDCTAVTGLLISYISDTGETSTKDFTFRDSHGNNLAGLGNLFGAGAYVKAILDTGRGFAYIQNADTNAYLESAMRGRISFNYVVVTASSFMEDSTYEDFPRRAAIALEGATADMIPEVVFSLADSISGIFAPVAESYNGGVYIYATDPPETDIAIPTIILWRGH